MKAQNYRIIARVLQPMINGATSWARIVTPGSATAKFCISEVKTEEPQVRGGGGGGHRVGDYVRATSRISHELEIGTMQEGLLKGTPSACNITFLAGPASKMRRPQHG